MPCTNLWYPHLPRLAAGSGAALSNQAKEGAAGNIKIDVFNRTHILFLGKQSASNGEVYTQSFRLDDGFFVC